MLAVLEAMNGIMDELGLNYEFEEWSGEDTYPYWTLTFLGDYHEDESGKKEHYPILNGHTIANDDDWTTLLEQAHEIEKYFKTCTTYICEDGSVFHAKIQNISVYPSQIPTHKEINISFIAKTWEVN